MSAATRRAKLDYGGAINVAKKCVGGGGDITFMSAGLALHLPGISAGLICR